MILKLGDQSGPSDPAKAETEAGSLKRPRKYQTLRRLNLELRLHEGHSAMDEALTCHSGGLGSNPDMTKGFSILKT